MRLEKGDTFAVTIPVNWAGKLIGSITVEMDAPITPVEAPGTGIVAVVARIICRHTIKQCLTCGAMFHAQKG